MSLDLTQFIGQSALIVSLVTGIFGVFFGLYITLARPNISSKQFTKFKGYGVANCVRNINRCGPSFNCSIHNFS